jgi:hypothetical protein
MTGRELQRVGVANVTVTGCPTTWSLSDEHCASVPTAWSRNVVTTLNYGCADLDRDRAFVRLLRQRFDGVALWPQAKADLEYARVVAPDLPRLPPTLAAFDEVLRSGWDYVGARLHGGIRALQHGRRTLIVVVDNRAREMGRDWSLPVWEPSSGTSFEDAMDHLTIDVALDRGTIDAWKSTVAAWWGR